MPSYKLIYFDVKGRGEMIRILFAYKGVAYEDSRIAFKDWPAMKDGMAYKQLPVLEVDGHRMSQSSAIVRYLARVYDLDGKTPLEAAKADEVCEAMRDIMQLLPWTETDPEKKKELMSIAVNDNIPPKLAILEKQLCGDYFLPQVSYTDIVFATSADYLQSLRADILETTPRLNALKNAVFSNAGVASYVKARPITSI